MRATTPSTCCVLLLATVWIGALAFPVAAQPADVDWRSTLIFRFEPELRSTDRAGSPADPTNRDSDQGNGAAGSGSYLSNIADELASGWITESSGRVVAVGPLFSAVSGSGGAAGDPVIDPLLGTPDDWMRLTSEAERAGVVVALHVRLPRTPEACSGLAQWVLASGIRHLFVNERGGCDVAALRAKLNAAGSGASWIAEVRDAGRGIAGFVSHDVSDAGGEATPLIGDSTSGVGENRTDAEADQLEIRRRSIEATQEAAARFDASVESVSPGALDDVDALGDLYRTLAQHVAEAPEPVVTNVSVSPESIRLASRALMLPGAVHVNAPAPPSDASDLWRSIAAFRMRHPAVSRGEHVDLVNNTFAFARTLAEGGTDDKVVIVLDASGSTTVNVSRIFPDNAMLQDALTGHTSFVSFGMATFESGPSGIILVEEVY